MNLNEDALADLDGSATIDDSLVKLPGTDLKPTEAITIVASDDQTRKPEAVPSDLIEKLPELDVTLKVINDGREKIIGLKEVQDEILSESRVSKESAQYVNSNFKGLFDGPVKLSEFTEGKSKTNLDYVIRHMTQVISKEEIAIASNVQVLLTEKLTKAKASFDSLLNTVIPKVNSEFIDLQALTAGSVEAIAQTKNAVFPYGENSFINLKTTDFCSMDVNKFPSLDSVVKSNILSLSQILKSPALTTFIHCVKDGQAVEEAISEDFHPTYSGSCVTGEDLIKFYTGNIDSYMDYMQNLCQAQLDYLNTLNTNSSAYIESSEVMNAFLAESLPGIEKAVAVLYRTTRIINNLTVLNFNAKSFIQFLSKL